jgi:hypothetical protein
MVYVYIIRRAVKPDPLRVRPDGALGEGGDGLQGGRSTYHAAMRATVSEKGRVT